MLQVFRDFFNYIVNLIQSFITLLKTPFQSQPCNQCQCEEYTDEQLFFWMKERSTLPTYPSDMLSERIINKPLKCSRCECPREKHGNLKPKLLTCDMMPNGGAVYVEMKERERLQKRQRRFAKTTKEVDVKVEKKLMKEGEGRTVQQGDQIECHYNAYITSSMEKFETSYGASPLNFRVGNGDVVAGIDQGVLGAKVGSKQRLTVPAALAYGAQKVNGERYVDMTFDVEVMAVLSN